MLYYYEEDRNTVMNEAGQGIIDGLTLFAAFYPVTYNEQREYTSL